MKDTNSGSAAHCYWFPEDHPERPLAFGTIFICFKGALDGVLSGCRVLIGVDGAHLKGNFGGVLLSAVAIDGNNELYPFAWGIVSSEDKNNRKFFVHHLKNVLQGGHTRENWCIIFDRQKVKLMLIVVQVLFVSTFFRPLTLCNHIFPYCRVLM